MSTPTQRDTLKAQFSDHQVPTGKDFAELIDATVIGRDDGLAVLTDPDQVQRLHIGRPLQVDSAARFEQGLTVAGQALHADRLQAGSADATLRIDSPTHFAQGLDVAGALHVNGGLSLAASQPFQADRLQTLTPDATLSVSSPARLEHTLDVAGATTLHTLGVGGTAHFEQGLSAAAGQPLKADRLQASSADVTLRVDSPTHFAQPLSTAGLATLDSLRVGRDSHLDGELTLDGLGKFNRGVNVTGGLDVAGPTTLNDGAQVGTRLDVAGPARLKNTLSVDDDATLSRQLSVAGATRLAGTLTVGGNARLGAELAVTGPARFDADVGVAGAAQVQHTLAVGHDTTLGQALSVAGATHLKEQLRVGGVTDLAGPLTVAGHAALAGTVDVTGAARFQDQLAVGGDTALAGALAVAGHSALAGTVDVTGATRLQHSLTVGGDAALAGTLDVTGTAKLGDSLAVAGHTALAGALDVTGATKMQDSLAVTGATRLEQQLSVGGATALAGTLAVSGDATLAARVDVTGAARLQDALTVAGPSQLAHTLDVAGATTLNNTLQVGGGAVIRHTDKEKAPLEILSHDNYSPLLVSASGNVGINTPAPVAQLQLTARAQRDLMLLQRQDADGRPQPAFYLNAAGQLAIGHAQPLAALDVAGDARLSGSFKVDADLDVDGKAVLGSASVENGLTVAGATVLQGSLEVDGAAKFDNGQTTFGTATFHHDVDLKSGLTVGAAANVLGDADLRRTLRVRDAFSADKDAGVGGKLDVGGDAVLKGKLTARQDAQIDGNTRLTGTLAVGGAVELAHSLRLQQGVAVHTLSDDPYLGEEAASDQALATQKAVKAYVDTYASPFGRGGRSWSVRTQAEFEQVFGDGSGEKVIEDNTTIILLPPREHGHSQPLTRLDGSRIAPGCAEWQGIAAYLLKNPVRLGSGVSIVGFNDDAVRVVKARADCRLLLEGRADAPLSRVTLQGFTFDGAGLPYAGHGGAIALKHARDVAIHARLVGHVARGNGGALYAEHSRRVSASNVHACQASSAAPQQRLSYGGAAYGLSDGEVSASRCYADVGGAVAACHDSRVHAQGCQALYGGAAYGCERLTLTARYCTAHYHGGGAYGCADLTASGYWTGNYCSQFGSRNIAAYTGDRQWHLWRGDFIERRIEPGWHCYSL